MKKALLFLGAFLMIATVASAQRSETGVKPQKTTKSTTTTEKKGVRFNLSLGYGTQSIKLDDKKYSLTGTEGGSTSGFFAGVSWDLDIAKGIGLEFADVAVAYYSGSDTQSYSDYGDYGDLYSYTNKMSVSFFNVFVSPVRFQYRYAINDKFAVFAATGPSLEYCLSYSKKITTTMSYSSYYNEPYEESSSDTDSELPWKSLYLYWDLQGGLQFSFIKLTLGTGFGLNNVYKEESVNLINTAYIKRPFFVKLSFVL